MQLNLNSRGLQMPNRKAKERKQDRKSKNLAIKRWKREQKKLKKENK